MPIVRQLISAGMPQHVRMHGERQLRRNSDPCRRQRRHVQVKDYRKEGPARYTTMTLATDEFIRRFLIHVLPKGLHRIRHYGLLASGMCAANLAKARELLGVAAPESATGHAPDAADVEAPVPPCPCCGARLRIIEVFERGETPHHRPSPRPSPVRIDTS